MDRSGKNRSAAWHSHAGQPPSAPVNPESLLFLTLSDTCFLGETIACFQVRLSVSTYDSFLTTVTI